MPRATALAVLALATALAPLAHGVEAPVGPVANGEFELAADAARPALCEVFGDQAIDVLPPESGPWLVGVVPCEQSLVTAAQWSHGSAVEYGDFDGDGDREARTRPGVVDARTGDHTMWQSYANPHQAWSGLFDELRFRVESGAIPANAAVVLSFSTSPVGDPHPWVGLYHECSLRFPAATLVPDAGGNVSVASVDGTFRSTYVACDDQAARWNDADATDEDRRAVLAGLRLVQHSYWSFNKGDVTIDGVEIVGARTVAHALAQAAADEVP